MNQWLFALGRLATLAAAIAAVLVAVGAPIPFWPIDATAAGLDAPFRIVVTLQLFTVSFLLTILMFLTRRG